MTPTSRTSKELMLVSAVVSDELRAEVRAGLRPNTEYLQLEALHGVRLLDWKGLSPRWQRRSVEGIVLQTVRALPAVRRARAVLSDGEHIGIPLALAMRVARMATPHVMIAHHLTTDLKRRLLQWTSALQRTHVVVHAEAQRRAVVEELDVPADRVHLLPYGVDTDFWAPRETREAPLVVAAGREHRDYRTFADAVSGLPVVAHVTDTSSHSPTADRNHPDSWPSNVRRRALPFPALREIYGEAQVVVVPLTATDFQAGITAVLEGMAMGKPVVVSDTDGLRGVVENGQNGVTVPVGDALALRQAIARLLSDENERRRIGKCARLAAVQRWSLQRYIDGLAWILSAAESRLGARSPRSPYPGAS